MAEKTVYLILENGSVFQGRSFGACREVTGELVFTTAMTGYLETLTDPSYYGQIVLQTFPLIGNYGVIPADFESAGPKLSAYIVRQWCQEPSNFRSEGNLDAFLSASGVVGVSGVDTRRLTKLIRGKGVLNARITPVLPEKLEPVFTELRAFRIRNAVAAVGGGEPREYYPSGFENCLSGAGAPRRRIVLWDFGAKQGIVRALLERGCQVTAVPARATASEILAMEPDGIMLSNGPGDPAENTGIIAELKKLGEAGLPLFGICLGHQLLALSQGACTGKLPYGHRGANQPVKDCGTGRVYITSQNHGYAVVTETLPPNVRESFRNANDGTNEGLEYSDIPAFSVQFHPEACGGPRDTLFLFDRFLQMVDEAHEREGAACH